MTIFRLLATKLFDGKQFYQNKVLTIKNGNIIAMDDDIERSDETAHGLIVPGFVDLQVNGGNKVLFNASPSLNNIKAIINAHTKFGTTAILPTLITDSIEKMSQAADAVAQAISTNVAGIIGIHFEGPHLSLSKKGAHLAKFIRPISDAEWQIFERQDLGQILITVAPENITAKEIKRLTTLGIKVCLGHSNADFDNSQKAIDAGADGFTHLYNAMSPLQARGSGMVGCAFINDHTSCGLIVDGHHVSYNSAKIAIKIKPQGKVFLVTDAMPLVGCDETEFDLFDRKVCLKNGKLTLIDGTLAGSVLTMATGVRNIYQHLGLELSEALRMASLYPAQYVNKTAQLGALTLGKQADMVLLDDSLHVQATWIAGQQVYKKQ